MQLDLYDGRKMVVVVMIMAFLLYYMDLVLKMITYMPCYTNKIQINLRFESPEIIHCYVLLRKLLSVCQHF